MKKLVVSVACALVVSGATAALAGCGPSAASEQTADAPTNTRVTLRETTREANPVSMPTPVPTNEARTTVPNTANSAPTPTPVQISEAAPTVPIAALPSTSEPVPADEDELEFVSPHSSGTLGRDGGITSVEKEASRKHRGLTGPAQGQTHTWEDGDRTLTVYLQTDLVVEKDSDGFPRDIVAASAGGTNLVRSAEEQSKGDSLPVFRSESGSILTLPGGVLLVLSADWTQAETNSFFANNGVKMDRVSELSYAANGFFIETEPGFPSLDLANELAELDGVEVSSPNWGREVVPK